MSRLREISDSSTDITWRDVENAWHHRESWEERHNLQDVTDLEKPRGALGGTICVHFIKKNEWFLETALALLGGEPGNADEMAFML